MSRRNVLSVKEFTKEELEGFIERARGFKEGVHTASLKGKILASCFFEPSTRTRLSFESAMLRLGGNVIGFSESGTTSIKKGESLYDTMRTISCLADVVVIRHPLEGAARQAAEATEIPIINAGDGANEHPSQTLLDLFTIQETQGRLEELHIACAGDLKASRTVHSLLFALRHFNPRLYFIAPSELSLPLSICDELKKVGIPFSYHSNIEEVISKLDILYMTRLQQERHPPHLTEETTTRLTGLQLRHLVSAKNTLRILHPLPRIQEIDRKIDPTPYAYYFQQVENGLYMRQALLTHVLEEQNG